MIDPGDWLRRSCESYRFSALGVYRSGSPAATWPVTAAEPDELTERLAAGGHLLPLPQEPAALANIVEVSIIDHLVEAARSAKGLDLRRGNERGYPDLEIGGLAAGGFYAVDVKVARRASTQDRLRTQSRITLYTGNTYFRWTELHWPGTFRPFAEYAGHWDIVVIYTLDVGRRERVTDVEVIVQEPWRIASRKRSSTTREYIGAVDLIDDLRRGRGEFESRDAFYKYWRSFPFRTTPAVQNQLQRLLDRHRSELDRLRAGREPVAPGVFQVKADAVPHEER